MALERAYITKLMASFFKKEATYDGGPPDWTSASACSLDDFTDQAAHEQWEDMVVDNTDVVSGYEFATKQQLVRQDVRIAFEQPRCKPNTVAGCGSLVLGVPTSTQDASLTAYRHKFTPASSVGQPSIAVEIQHDTGAQRLCTGVKGETFILSMDEGAFLRLQCQLFGSGSRATASDAFAPYITEDWLLKGNAKLYWRDTGGTPITIPSTPSQTASNLGGTPYDFGSRVLAFQISFNNDLQPDHWYRPGGGLVRSNFHPQRRRATISFTIEADSATEAAELNYYLLQNQMAFEVNLNSGVVIAATGAFKYGLIAMLPRVQLRRPQRGQTSQLTHLMYEATIMDDITNPAMILFVYNKQSAYMA